MFVVSLIETCRLNGVNAWDYLVTISRNNRRGDAIRSCFCLGITGETNRKRGQPEHRCLAVCAMGRELSLIRQSLIEKD